MEGSRLTRAAVAPKYGSPWVERLGYLRHVVEALDTSSPDALHGAAHFAPLTGLSLPILDLFADLNDAAIAAGLTADLDERDAVRSLTRRRILAEIARAEAASRAGSHAEVLGQLSWEGEATAAEVALAGAPDTLGPIVAARLRGLIATAPSPDGTPRVAAARAVVASIDAGDADAARRATAALLDQLGVAPLPAE